MTNFLKKFLYLPILFVLIFTSAYAGIPIHIMPNAGLTGISGNLTKQNIKTITEQALAQEHINIDNHSRYAFIQTQLIQTTSERYLLVHLMSRYYFSYQIMRINLNSDHSIKYPIIKNYHLQPADFAAQSNNTQSVAPQCPAQYQTGKPLFVIGTPYYSDTHFTNISPAVNSLSQAVLKTNQYQLVKLLDDKATIQNYQNILACPNLKYFFHIGHAASDLKSFSLTDGDFEASYFSQKPPLNLHDKVITLDSCELFDQVDQGFCPILSKMANAPQAFSSGSSDLLILGSVETYTCFWKAILQGAPMTQATLTQCAISNDPSVNNSQSGTYLLGGDVPVRVQTNQRVITIQPDDYTILKLNNGERVTQYAMKNNGQTVVCTSDPMNRITLLNNPELTAGEFTLTDYDSSACQFTDFSRMQRPDGFSRDIYGFYPAQQCFSKPPKPQSGLNLTSSSEVDINCNGIAYSGIINAYGLMFDWPDFASQFQSNSLDCTFSADTTKTEIASLHLNILPSATSPGEFSGQISNVKNMNGYPLPTITYSGNGDAPNYYKSVSIFINSK